MKNDLEKRKLVSDLKRAKVKIWAAMARELSRATKKMPSVNVSKIQQHTRDGETALIPGKVLSVGKMDRKLTVAAFKFSDAALTKINANGKALTIQELLKTNPKGNKVRILK